MATTYTHGQPCMEVNKSDDFKTTITLARNTKSEEIDKLGGSMLRLVLPTSSDFLCSSAHQSFQATWHYLWCFSINISTSGK